MTSPRSRHAAPDPLATIRTPRFWLQPIVVVLVVFSALAALYLGGILNPTTNLHSFPVAVVNQDQGPDGRQIADGLVSGLDARDFDVRVLSAEEAERQLDAAQVYGVVQIPADFSAGLQALAAGVARPGEVVRPVVTVSTNPRAGELGGSIAGVALGKAVQQANIEIGKQITAQVEQASGGAHSLVMTSVGLVIGLLIGAVVTRFYDRRGLRRIHNPPAESAKES